MAVVTRTRGWTALLTALVLAVLTGLLMPGPASAEGTSGEKSVYINTVTGGDGPRTPDIISTSANNAVVAWREGLRPGSVDMGYMRYSYTTDGGAHWSRPQTLAQETDQYAWHYVMLYKSGSELFAFLGRTPIADASEPDGINNNGLPINAIIVKRSTDEGHTWQDYSANVKLPLDLPETPTIDEGYANLAISGRPLKLANGNTVIPFWASGRENGVLISSGADLTKWTAGTVAGGLAHLAGENQIVVSPGSTNELIMVARSGEAEAVTATGANGGKDWTAFTSATGLPSNNAARSYFGKDSNGQLLYIYTTGASDTRLALYYKTKRPGATSWSATKKFADGLASEEDTTPAGTGKGWDTYPMADEYAPGKFFVTWEFDTTRIKVNKLDISDAP
ncbi:MULTISPECIES: sialidase family protein [unclassified Streptomyces]|uniref:sialidase family protein n=1 Tax=unclassified Streptomyces TaxID=2593676 RepID=UPI0036E741D0